MTLWLAAALALAEPPADALAGAWQVHRIETARGAMRFPETLASDDGALVDGRWRWVFGDDAVTMVTQVLTRPEGEREQLVACEARTRVPYVRDGVKLELPPIIEAESTVLSLVDGQRPGLHTCRVQLTGVPELRIIALGRPDAPEGSVTLSTPDDRLRVVIVPDPRPASLSALVP